MSGVEQPAAFEDLLVFLREARGFDFTGYKRPSLVRRVRRRMQLAGAADYEAYQRHLQDHPAEFAQLFNTILINVTAFFRDPPAWNYVAAEIVPALLRAKAAGEPLRAWSAGCASGEEAYSIAMMLAEAMGIEAFRQRVKIYATDVDEHALAQGRLGVYGEKAMGALSPELRERYFVASDGRYQFRQDLRRSLIFGRNDLVQDELREARQQLEAANEELQSSNEELETTNEELQSSNEELETTNEELQSTNEELETMNEELQSTNEELQALNEELRKRKEEADRTHALLRAVFTSLRSGAVALTRDLEVLAWNPRAEDLWGMREGEVLGRSLSSLEIGLPVAELRALIGASLAGEENQAEMVLDAVNRRGRKIKLRVGCAPLVLANGKRDGVVLTMDEL